MFEHLDILDLILGTLRVSTPLILAALGGLMSERSGTVQIALEGQMIMGALFAAIVSYFSGSPWLGLLAGMVAGATLAALMGFFVLKLKTDQIVTGAAINILAAGVAAFVTKVLFNSTGPTPALSITQRFSWEPMPIAFVCLLLVAVWYYRSRSGLWLQFAGESPQAVVVAGLPLQTIRWLALLKCGSLCGLAGGSLSLFLSSSFSPGMTGGRGFIALAALIFGKWRPWPTAFACLLFGFMDAVQIRLQGGNPWIPVQFVQILPYLVTIVALAGFFGHSRAPQALGQQPEI